jgi:hypothetical protein
MNRRLIIFFKVSIMSSELAKITPIVTKEIKSFRDRDHRFSKMTVPEVLRIQMSELSIKNVDLQRHLGFLTANVISMMKNGTMRVPVMYAAKIADFLELDKLAFLRKVVEENDPNLWDALMVSAKIDFSLTANESKLVSFVRTELDGFDVDLSTSPEFKQALKSALSIILKQEIDKKNSLLSKIDATEEVA